MDQLNELSLKFQGHYMTKMNKQLKSEKEILEKNKIEMVRHISYWYSNHIDIDFTAEDAGRVEQCKT